MLLAAVHEPVHGRYCYKSRKSSEPTAWRPRLSIKSILAVFHPEGFVATEARFAYRRRFQRIEVLDRGFGVTYRLGKGGYGGVESRFVFPDLGRSAVIAFRLHAFHAYRKQGRE